MRNAQAEPEQHSDGVNALEMRYRELAAEYGNGLERLARAYEADPEIRRDLLQDIHVALWRSLRGFDGRCSARTWVYRVAHNVATSHVLKRRREREKALLSLEELDVACERADAATIFDCREAHSRLMALVHTLRPLDRQIIVLYLEDFDAASIGEVTGMSSGNVATKIHRIKRLLFRRFHEGGKYEQR